VRLRLASAGACLDWPAISAVGWFWRDVQATTKKETRKRSSQPEEKEEEAEREEREERGERGQRGEKVMLEVEAFHASVVVLRLPSFSNRLSRQRFRKDSMSLYSAEAETEGGRGRSITSSIHLPTAAEAPGAAAE
jgi:hypothetical protein